ncbi:MAG: hypothetical protein IPM60_05505 [Rhodospirillales bacterium]|nr:hypothetical protein [Rhodospirillales bacterium]
MNLEKVLFGFFLILALTLNVGFVIGDIENPTHHSVVEFFFLVVVNLVATGLKLGDRTQIGALLLATSLVADLQLIAATGIWAFAAHVAEPGVTAEDIVHIVSLATGALVANIISVTVFVAETLMLRR